MTLDTLLLLRQCLQAQQLAVSDPQFTVMARRVITALDELDEAIAEGGSADISPTVPPPVGPR